MNVKDLRNHLGELVVAGHGEDKVQFTVALGTVMLSKCGPIVTDADGWSHFQMSDTYQLDHWGREVPGTRRPSEPVIRWKNMNVAEPKRAWWRFWG